MQTVLVTGGLGFCGTHLLRRLRQGPPVRALALDLPPRQAYSVADWDGFLAADISNPADVERAIASVHPDLVFHLAGRSAGSAAELNTTNVGGTAALLDALASHAPGARVLVAGSAAEYGHVAAGDLPISEELPCRPAGEYGRSKLEATRVALASAAAFGLHVVVVRPFNIVGAGMPASLVGGALIERLCGLRARGETALRVGNLDTERDFAAVDDIVDAYVRLLMADVTGVVVNLCSGKPRSIRSLVELLRTISGVSFRIEVDPALVRADDVPVSFGSFDKARRLIGFQPRTPLELALRAAWTAANDTPTWSGAIPHAD